jgi:CheY-like chemotaxis protein
VRPGTLVLLDIRDTGPGIDAQNLARVFEPFFTTKTVGRGLGLSAVQGILRSQGAGIRIQSAQSQGTLFRLYFPPSALQNTSGAPEAPATESTRKASILFVDDEPEILNVGSTLLEEMGFEVTLARDGLEAVELFRQEPEAFDLVILDVSMPRMDGREAFALLRQLRAVPVLFCSGYSQEEIPARILNNGDVAFLNKPYRIRDFQKAIAQLLPRVAQP